jgi:hypothetical protein
MTGKAAFEYNLHEKVNVKHVVELPAFFDHGVSQNVL